MEVTTPVLNVSGLGAAYRSRTVLHGVTLGVEPGDVVAILGSNGAGKSTLLKCLAGLLPAACGKIALRGTDVTNASPRARQRLGLGFLMQGGRVFPNLTCQENVLLASSRMRGNSSSWRHSSYSVGWLFPALKGRDKEEARVLSGGQRQMLAVELMLLQRPVVALFDEPTAALSPDNANFVLRAIRKYATDERCGVLLVEQNIEDALGVSDRMIKLEAGRVVEERHTEQENVQCNLSARRNLK